MSLAQKLVVIAFLLVVAGLSNTFFCEWRAKPVPWTDGKMWNFADHDSLDAGPGLCVDPRVYNGISDETPFGMIFFGGVILPLACLTGALLIYLTLPGLRRLDFGAEGSEE